MSIINEALAPCTKCGQQHKVTVYRSINISENPELKAKVTDGSLFLWECPHCGQVNLAKYETLYHDPAAKLMVWLIPSGEISETQMQAITMHTKAMGGYTLRRVNDMGHAYRQEQDDQQDDAEHTGQLFRQELLHRLHIGGAALNQVTGAVLSVPGEADPLQMGKEPVAHGLHKRFGGDGLACCAFELFDLSMDNDCRSK